MAEKSNVCRSLLSYSGVKGTFLLIFFFACPEYGVAEECNFSKCILSTMSFVAELRRNHTRSICSDFLNLEACSDHCMHKYYPKKFSSDFEPNGFAHFCSEKIASSSNVNWVCIGRHAYRLLTCLGNVSTLTTNHVHGNAAIAKESCRQSLEFPKCASTVLSDECGENSAELVKDMLQYAVNYFMPSTCKALNLKKIMSMPVYFYTEDRFLEIARCLDKYMLSLFPCFNSLMQNDVDIKEFVCGEGDSFLSCVAFQAQKECKEVADETFVRKLLFKIFSLGGIRCEQPQFTFPQLTSPDSDEMEDTKHSPDEQIASHPSLNDDHQVLPQSDSDYPDPSTVQTATDGDETGSSVSGLSPISEVDSTVDSKRIHASDSLLKDSGDPSQHRDTSDLKTSSSLSLICDRTLVAFASILVSLFF